MAQAARPLIASVGAGRMGRGIAHAFAYAGHEVHLLDIISGSEQRVLEGHTDYIHDVTFNPAGDRHAVVANDAHGCVTPNQNRLGHRVDRNSAGRALGVAGGAVPGPAHR